MSAALILALVQAAKFALDVVHDLQSGAITPDEAKTRWDHLIARLQEHNDAWDAAGLTPQALVNEGTTPPAARGRATAKKAAPAKTAKRKAARKR
jgi:DNA-binding protein H-NS